MPPDKGTLATTYIGTLASILKIVFSPSMPDNFILLILQ